MKPPDHQDYTHPGRNKWIFAGISAAIIALFLWSEHRGHVLGALPYLLLFACPLMHLLHHGHGHGRRHDGEHSNKKMMHEGKVP